MNRKAFTLIASALCCVFLLGTASTTRAESEAVQLSDTTGRVITAKIIAVSGEEVEIEWNGQNLTLPLTKFSLTSRELIKKHAGEPDKPEEPAPDPTSFVDTPIFTFKDLKFDEDKTDHFSIRTIDVKPKFTEADLEGTFDLFVNSQPDLTRIFEKQGFQGPREPANSNDFPDEDKRFRHQVYVVSDPDTYSEMVNQYYNAKVSDEQRRLQMINSSTQTGNFGDFSNRFVVALAKENQPIRNLIAHHLGGQLTGATTQRQNGALPFWLKIGAGYFAEHKLTDLCVVHYIDFKNYYESEAGVAGGAGPTTRTQLLSNSEPWIKPIQELCKDGKRVNLARLCEVNTEVLTPNDSGYAMALYAFMASTPERIKSLNNLLDKIEKGLRPGPQDIADEFRYASPEEFEEAWYEYILSADFKRL